MLVALNDHLVLTRLLLSLEVTERTPNSVNDIIRWVNRQILRMLLMWHWRPKLIGICHHAWMGTCFWLSVTI